MLSKMLISAPALIVPRLPTLHCLITHVWVSHSQAPLTASGLRLPVSGRYEDDVTAAKAYDKAAVYLYGANAITNFGLAQVAEDPTEVRHLRSVQITLQKTFLRAESPFLASRRPVKSRVKATC
jgi:hypothetical protein